MTVSPPLESILGLGEKFIPRWGRGSTAKILQSGLDGGELNGVARGTGLVVAVKIRVRMDVLETSRLCHRRCESVVKAPV